MIAEFTAESAECVFADDLALGDAWVLKEITRDESRYVVHWTFVDGTDAYLTVDNS
ncbi:MAG: hypothetical protein ACKVKF_26620 [Rhodobacterales bacterium]